MPSQEDAVGINLNVAVVLSEQAVDHTINMHRRQQAGEDVEAPPLHWQEGTMRPLAGDHAGIGYLLDLSMIDPRAKLLVIWVDGAVYDPEAVAKLKKERDAALKRIDDLLALVVKVTNETPYPEELQGWEKQRRALIAEVGTLRAERDEAIRERDAARDSLAQIRAIGL